MSDQLDMLLVTEEAIARAERNADQSWMKAAKRVVWQLIQEGVPFTNDQVWDRLDALGVVTHEPRALGSVIRAAAKAGWITKTGEYFASERPQAHSRPQPLWLPQKKAAA